MGSQAAGLTAVMAVGSTDGVGQSSLPCCPVSRLGGSPAECQEWVPVLLKHLSPGGNFSLVRSLI